MTIKQKRGYLNAKKAIEKFLSQSTKYSSCVVVPKVFAKGSFYCYTYEIANELANFLCKYRNLERIKSESITDTKEFKYLIIR